MSVLTEGEYLSAGSQVRIVRAEGNTRLSMLTQIVAARYLAALLNFIAQKKTLIQTLK